MSLNGDFQKLYVDGIVTLYELDASKLGAGILRFHSHISYQDWERIYALAGSQTSFAGDQNTFAGKVFDNGTNKVWMRNIIWQGQTFEPMALEVSGLEMRTGGKASAPTLTMANNINGVQHAVSAYCLKFKDFADAKLKVITTVARCLDADNFSNGNPNASSEAKEQLWYVEQKTAENAKQVTFELSNPVDFEGKKIPLRQITGMCHWACTGGYRGEECGYTGTAMFTDKDEPTDNPALDKCGARIRSCNLRFGKYAQLPFGGVPSAKMMG